MITDQDREHINVTMRIMDEAQIAIGAPILSVMVVLDDGSPNPVTLDSLSKYQLRKDGESIAQAIKRIRYEAYQYYAKRGAPW